MVVRGYDDLVVRYPETGRTRRGKYPKVYILALLFLNSMLFSGAKSRRLNVNGTFADKSLHTTKKGMPVSGAPHRQSAEAQQALASSRQHYR